MYHISNFDSISTYYIAVEDARLDVANLLGALRMKEY